jgi:hypothetical protein
MLLLAVFPSISSANEKAPRLRDGSIGAAFVSKETDDAVVLNIVFPVTTLREKLTVFPSRERTVGVQAPERIELFDEEGILGVLPSVTLSIIFWCENDEGAQYRPEGRVVVKQTALARPLRAVAALQGVAAFVIASSRDAPVPPPATKPSGKLFLSGRTQAAGPIVAYVWAAHDGANNCTGKPRNDWVTTLRAAKDDGELRCCGP